MLRTGLVSLALLLLLIHTACQSAVTDSSGLSERPDNTTCLAPAEPGPSDANIPTQLSETGCVLAANPTQAATGLIPYTLNVPFWSDGALKERWMALPNEGTITLDDDGAWQLPIGTVLQKNFQLNGQLIETRHLMRFADGTWRGYSYEWDENQNDATLVGASGKNRSLSNGQVWTYPSRFSCLVCHNAQAGILLGIRTDQLNRTFLYPQTTTPAQQLETLKNIGVLELTAEISTLAKFPEQTGELPTEETLSASARAYLDTNCAFCHRPGGIGGGPEDFRASIPLAQTNTCDVEPQVKDFGIPNARLLTPGDPASSILWHRMTLTDIDRMPPLASNVNDEFGIALIEAWIQSLSSCEE